MAANECDIQDLSYYTAKNIPAAGSFIRKDDSQISLFLKSRLKCERKWLYVDRRRAYKIGE